MRQNVRESGCFVWPFSSFSTWGWCNFDQLCLMFSLKHVEQGSLYLMTQTINHSSKGRRADRSLDIWEVITWSFCTRISVRANDEIHQERSVWEGSKQRESVRMESQVVVAVICTPVGLNSSDTADSKSRAQKKDFGQMRPEQKGTDFMC